MPQTSSQTTATFNIDVITPASKTSRPLPPHLSWPSDDIPIIDHVPTSMNALADHVFKHAAPSSRKHRVMLIEGGSQYGTLNFFTKNIQGAFNLRGHTAESLDLHTSESGNSGSRCSSMVKRLDPTLYMSLNGIHEALTLANHKTFGQHFKQPSISWFVDHPFIQLKRVKEPDYAHKINAHAVVDGFHNIYDRIRPKDQQAFNATLPIVGEPVFDHMKPFDERSNRLLVPASFTPFSEKYAKLSIPKYPMLERLAKDTVDYLIADPDHAGDTFFLDGLEALGMDAREIDPLSLMVLYVSIHQSAEMYWRENMLKAAKDVPLKLFGRGWEKADFLSDKWEVCAPPAMDVLTQWYGDSQHVWNIFPLYPQSGHDRIFYSTANGANIITERKAFLESTYGDSLNYLTQDVSQVGDALNAMIHAPDAQRAEQADRAQRLTLSRRTYLSAVLNIEDILERHQLRTEMTNGLIDLPDPY